MPISVVVGGQFGSEGKGKVSSILARSARAAGSEIVVCRVGGPNSGHTAYDVHGRRYALRQMPAGCVDRDVDVVFPAGSYIDIDVLRTEIELLNYPVGRIRVSPYARLITDEHKAWERSALLTSRIGSTGSGVGAAVMASVAREAANFPLRSIQADSSSYLEPFICDTTDLMVQRLAGGHRVIVEGSQGFGLSLLDGGYWPKATARVTTAAGALAEAGLSPLDVDDITVVLRTFPIRVAGDSGPLAKETTWEAVSTITGRGDRSEYTTVTKKLRRVGEFDPDLVRRAIVANKPTRVVLNHMDYLGSEEQLKQSGSAVAKFLRMVEVSVGREIDWVGFSPEECIPLRDLVNG